MFRLSFGGFSVIEIKKDEGVGYHNVNMTEFESEMNSFGFEISNVTGYRKYDKTYSGIETSIKKGDFNQILVLGVPSYTYRNIKFVIPEENGVIKVDGNFVEAYYQNWKKKNDQKKIRENVAEFKTPLVFSFIRGTLDSADIEYKDESNDDYYFRAVTTRFTIHYRIPPPGELGKLNLENIKVHISFAYYNIKDVPLKKFVNNPEEYLKSLKEISDKYSEETKKLQDIVTRYQNEIEKIESELNETNSKFSKMNLDNYNKSIKELFKDKK